MKSLSLVLAFAAAVSCDPYTIGQVASGYTHGGLITGVDYGNGVVSGVGAIGNRGVVTLDSMVLVFIILENVRLNLGPLDRLPLEFPLSTLHWTVVFTTQV